MATSAKKCLPVNDQGVAAAHERVLLDVSQQEAALVSLLLGGTTGTGPGQELYDQLASLFPVDGPGRRVASRAAGKTNTTDPAILDYLGQYPGE